MEDLRWGYGNPANVVEPPTAKKSNGWNAGEPAAAQYLNWWMKNAGEMIGLAPGLLHGLNLSNNATDGDNSIDIAPGIAADSAGTKKLPLTAPLVKELDNTWAEGSASGGRFSGVTLSDDTWYHLFLIRNDDNGNIDAGFDDTVVPGNLPEGWSSYRRLGSIKTEDSSNNILGFFQEGDKFLFDAPIADFSVTAPGTSAMLQPLTVPPGLKVRAIVDLGFEAYGGSYFRILVTSPDQTSVAPNLTLYSLKAQSSANKFANGRFIVRTDTAGQIQYQVDYLHGSETLTGTLIGWIDSRGR